MSESEIPVPELPAPPPDFMTWNDIEPYHFALAIPHFDKSQVCRGSVLSGVIRSVDTNTISFDARYDFVCTSVEYGFEPRNSELIPACEADKGYFAYPLQGNRVFKRTDDAVGWLNRIMSEQASRGVTRIT